MGLIFALVFWWRSLYPSMMPRGPGWQAAVSAVSIGVGYLLGMVLGALGNVILTRTQRQPSERFRWWAWIVLADSFAIGMLLLGLSGLWMWARGRGVKQVFGSVLFVGLVVWLAVFAPAMW